MKNNKNYKKIIAFIMAGIIFVSIIVFSLIGNKPSDTSSTMNVNAAVDPTLISKNERINSLKELYEFSEYYHNNASTCQHWNVILNITGNITISPSLDIDGEPYTWYPIGTSSKPFNGRVTINIGTGLVQNIEANAPIFDYITDTVEIVNSNDSSVRQQINLVRNVDADSPLFANNVVHDSNANSTQATWLLGIGAYDAVNDEVYGTGTYGGIIGTVGTGSDNTVANLDITLYSSANVSSSNNAGVICGKIQKNSKANATYNSNSKGTVTNVTSTNGNAGYFAGEMCEGAELNITRNSKIDVSSGSRVISGKTNAGGLIGKNDRGTVVIKNTSDGTEEKYNALGTVTATDGNAGSVFGYYKVSSDYNRFSPTYYTSTTGCTLSGKTVGGLVGVLEADGIDVSYSGTPADSNSGTSESRVSVVSTLSGNHTTYGGIIGSYSNTSLAKSLTIEIADVTMNGNYATNYGGAVGSLGGNSAVYVKVDNFTLNSTGSVGSCTYFGGIIGSAGSKGSMLDVGSVTVTTSNSYQGGGVVGQLSSGALRLSGTTNLSGANASSGGQIVGERKNALVYALGSGNDAAGISYGDGWRLVRSSTDVSVDDIGIWGEVVRIANIETETAAVAADPEADPPIEAVDAIPAIVSFSTTDHTVTVASAVTDMETNRDVVRTALNMQLNDGSSGALRFDSSSNRTSLLANTELTIAGTISLSGTGITGFMRDGSTYTDNKYNDDTEIKSFTGKLSKASEAETAKIELAVGQRYGVLSNGSLVSDSNSTGRGAIYRHRFNGLFARSDSSTASPIRIENITIGGFINVNASADYMYIGGASAYVHNAHTFSNVSAIETINYKRVSGSTHYVGGLIGRTNADAGQKVTVKGTDSSNKVLISPTIIVTGTCADNAGTAVDQCVGGVIGYISSVAGTVASQTETEISYVTLSANIDASGATGAANVSMAGLISDIAWDTSEDAVDSDRDTRKLILSNIDVKDTFVKNKATNTTGGVLGYRWFSADVDFSNVKLISGTGNNELNTSASYIGGLVYKATGNWYVPANGIAINSLAIKNGNNTAAPSGLGLIVHDGYYSASGLFLEMTAYNSYALASSGLTIPVMTASGKIYDELVACLSDSVDSLLRNNTSGIISYKTNGAYSMGGAGTRNSYNNKYNTTVVNNRARYYYNADRNMSSSNGFKLLKWSLNRYAAVNLKRKFTNPFSDGVLNGNFDLEKVSYYPIDIEDDVTIGNATFVFYNDNIEATETASNTSRSTRDGNSQHYLMHMGLFKNVSATISTTDDITMYGSVGVNETYSGALINGTLTGMLETSSGKKIYIGDYDGDDDVAYPLSISDTDNYLFINKIGDGAILTLNGLYINGNAYYNEDDEITDTYASSLIGDVQGKGITLNFSDIKIDARNKEDVDIAEYNKNGVLSYGTSKSIFKHATLLNKYDVDSTSIAIYNFSQLEDWRSATSAFRKANVTYGKELTDTIIYRDENDNSEENKYYENGENGNYIDPESNPEGNIDDPDYEPYSFSDDFLPYVRYYNRGAVSGAPTPMYTLREIKVNVVSADLKIGCGTYDHPYDISNAKQLVSLAKMLENFDNVESDNIKYIELPLSKEIAASNMHWCCTGTIDDINTTSCHLFEYKHSLGRYEYEGGGTTYSWGADDVREYLAGAYYVITSNIVLGDTFPGLGAFNNSACAFKGVIVGKNDNITITNKSHLPFIKISNGSVVKRLNLVIDNYDANDEEHKSVVITGGTSTAFSYSNNDLVYGGLIGKIMGGDNIIDKVSVSYTNSSNDSGYVQVEGTSDYLYCVGGYVGVIVNGALIFRNMPTIGDFKVNTSSSATTNFATSTDTKHLYINPYIGRVINGYAIYETTSYSGDSIAVKDELGNNVYKYYDASGNELKDVGDSENDERIAKTVQQFKYDSTASNYTLNNSTKNYQIANVKTANINKISFGTYDSKNTIDIPDGQALFILSLITQSGAGTAPAAGDNYAYAVSYDGTTAYWANINKTSETYRTAAQNTATHLAEYSKVGTAVFADKTSDDYVISKGDTQNSKSALPYIIYKYTQGTTTSGVTSYKARTITYPGNTMIMRLTSAGSNYNLPESFRGIGAICTMHGGNPDNSNSSQGNDEDGRYALELFGLEGNGATVNNNLDYKTYCNSLDNYICTVYGINTNANKAGEGNNDTGIHTGFGLFNYVKQIKKTGNTTGYELASGYYIGNFTLSGKVSVEEYKADGTTDVADKTNDNGVNRRRTRHLVGGVTGGMVANDYLNFYKLDLVNIKVSGTSMVGGYVGKCDFTGRDGACGEGKMSFYANCCNTENLEVISKGGACAGMISGYALGFLDVYINTAPNSGSLAGPDNHSKSSMNLSITNTTNADESGTGGIIGTFRTGLNQIFINNVTLSGMNGKSYINNTDSSTNAKRGVGGFIGYARKAGVIIVSNSSIYNINITGPCAGGIFGYIEDSDANKPWGQTPYIRVYKCKIENNETKDGELVEHKIEGQLSAGGISGFFTTTKGSGESMTWNSNGGGDSGRPAAIMEYVHGYDESDDTTTTKYIYDIDGCEISGYTIAQKNNTDTDYGVGGFIGYAAGTTRTIVNSSVHDCVIKVEGGSTKHYMGGLVGYTAKAFSGYNVSSYNNTFTYQSFSKTSATNCGNFIGNTKNQIIKIAGFSRQNNYRETSATSKTIVAKEAGTGTYGTNGYIIDADYMGINHSDDKGTAMSAIMPESGVTNVGEGARKNYYPYVSVSPEFDMGGTNILTGDGISIVNGSPIADLIYSEKTAADENRIPYNYSSIATDDWTKVNKMITNGKDTTSDHDIKLTTYFTEMGKPAGYEGSDFPVIAIGGGITDYTNYIKAYINVLTNSSSSYNGAALGTNQDNNRYKIYIYPCRCIDGVYQRVNNVTQGLKYSKSGTTYIYSMDDSKADSIQPNNQISMIDICYCDPTATSKTAYHLYIPVLTKKLLKFNFSSTALQGTEYEPSVYEANMPDNWGGISKLGSGFDAWQTLYLKYEYTKEEVDQFLATGKGLNWNVDKSLHFNYNADKSLATSTEFVLLDNNTNIDKQYYKKKESTDTQTNSLGNKYDVINFADFVSSNSTVFTSQKLKDIAGDKIIYTEDPSGKYVSCAMNQATVIAYPSAGGVPMYFKEGTSGTKYTLTLKEGEVISETYYLSIYTYDKDNVLGPATSNTYGIVVECPTSFTSNIITCQRNYTKNTQMYLGDFLSQTNLIISNINDNGIISSDNHVITATLTSTVEFSGGNETYFHMNLEGEKLYQGFYLYLNRYDEDGNLVDDCSIKGTPSYSYKTTVGEITSIQENGVVDSGAPYLYVNPVEITIPVHETGVVWSSTQEAEIALDFGSNESKLNEEFPARIKKTDDVRGIGLDAATKLGFVYERVQYSNNIKTADDPPTKRYYIDRTGQSGVLTLTAREQAANDEYDMYGEQSKNKSALGINGMYIGTGGKYSSMGDKEHIDIGLDYDVTSLPDEVFTDGGYTLDFTIRLEQKNDSNESPGYEYVPVNIEDLSGTINTGYLDDFEFLDKNDSALNLTSNRSGESQDGYLYYTYTMPLTTTQSDWTINYSDSGGQKHFTSSIGFDVKTESLLKAIDGYKYANYRIKVTARISKGTTAYTSEDYIVYTNARVNAEYVVESH